MPILSKYEQEFDFRQDTPKMQLAALHMAIQGNISNFQDGIITKEVMLERVNRYLVGLEICIKLVGDGSWEEG